MADERRTQLLLKKRELLLQKKQLLQQTQDTVQPDFSNKFIPQFTKGLYEKLPFGKRVVSLLPHAKQIEETQRNIPDPTTVRENIGRGVGEIAPDIALSIPFFGGAGAIPGLSTVPKLAIGAASFAGTKKAVEGKKEEIIPAATGAGLSTLALGYAGKFAGKGLKNLFNIGKTRLAHLYNKVAKNTVDKIAVNVKSNPVVAKALGLKEETLRLIRKYGYDKVSNASLVDDEAAIAFETVMQSKTNLPNNTINIKGTLSKLEALYSKLKGAKREKIGNLITRLRNLQPAREGFFKTKVPTSGQLTRQLRGEKLTDIAEEVRVTKQAFSTLRKEIRAFHKDFSSPEVNKIIDSLYDDAENAGLKGIKQARSLYRQSKEINKSSVINNIAKVEKLDQTKIYKDLLSVVNNKDNYGPMLDKYTRYLGRGEAVKLLKEALAVQGGETAKRIGGKALKFGAAAAIAGGAAKKIFFEN